MARVKISDVIKKMCKKELEDKYYFESSISLYESLDNHTFKLTLDYCKDSNDPNYKDLPEELVFTGTYSELYEKVYGSGLIESEYAYASKIKEEEKYGSMIQVRIRELEIIE